MSVSEAVDKTWGIRSHVTGRVYLWARSQDFAEVMQAGTGRPDAYEIVQLVDGCLVTREARPTAPPVPEFAQRPVHDGLGADDEDFRMFVYSHPLHDLKNAPRMTLTAAEIRQRADARRQADQSRWRTALPRFWRWSRRHTRAHRRST